jgi:hypothetical protein
LITFQSSVIIKIRKGNNNNRKKNEKENDDMKWTEEKVYSDIICTTSMLYVQECMNDLYKRGYTNMVVTIVSTDEVFVRTETFEE